MTIPRLFVVGDSISIGYGPFLERCVAGWMPYDRKSGLHEALKDLDVAQGANGGDSSNVLAYLESWKARGGLPAEVLLLNCGLHDLKKIRASGQYQVPLDLYRANLEKIVAVVRAMKVKLVWVRTTQVNEQWHQASKPFDRLEKDVDAYNLVADGIMAAGGAGVCDLYTLTKNIPDGMSPDGVHFNEKATQMQGAFIAGYLGGFFGKERGDYFLRAD